MAAPRPRTANLNSARLTDVDGDTIVDDVRFGIRGDLAYATDRRGTRVWEAQIGDWARNGRKSITVFLVDPPGAAVTAISFCRPCKQSAR